MTPLDKLSAALQKRKDAERGSGARMFGAIPDRWFDSWRWRCVNGHVSTSTLQSEEHGDLCLGCYAPVRLTFPEDTETDPPTVLE